MANKKIQLTTNVDNQIVDVYPVTKSEFVEFSDGKTLDEKINTASTEHKHDLATPAKDGFMSKEDKAKLDGVTNYTHPNTHAATMITEDNDHRFVTDAEKNKWNNKVDAVLATNASNGLMSASDKQKIDDLNNQFKNRDDKIEKNKEDIKSWNDEMIDKKYQYFNKENNTINDSIVSKTFDMVIQGKTIHNLVVNGNEKGIIDKKINDNTRLQNRTISYDLIPGKTYIGYINVIKYEGSFSNGGLRIYGNVAGSASKIAEKTGWTKFEWTIPDSIMSPITSISIYIESSDFNNGCIIEFDSLMLFEENSQIEDLTEYCNGIKSFGEQENNNIKIISNNENLIIPPEKTVSGGYASIDIKMNTDGTIIINGNSTGTGGRQAFFEKIPTIKIEKGKSYILSANCENLSGVFLNRISDNTAYVGTTTASYFVAEEDIEVYVGVNLKIMNYDNEVIYPMLIENKKTKPFIFNKSDKNNILLKEPLRSIDKAYDKIWKNNKQVELIRRVCQYTFVGKEDWIFNAERGDFVRFLCKMDKKPANSGTKKIISNIFPSNGDVFDKPTIFAYTTHGIVIAIEKSKLSSPDVNGFKQWLTNNNLTVVYELAEKETEVLENCMDLNLNTFSNKTYITSNNNIKGKLSFSVPINTAANLENGSKRLNNIEDFIDTNKNNIDKISKLEEGAITSSLNIIDLQKDIKNNNDYTHYSGNNISIVNSKESRTSNMIIKGETLQNIYKSKGSYNGNVIEIDTSWFKPSTKYTIFHNTDNLGLLDYIVFASNTFTDLYHLKTSSVFTTDSVIPQTSYFHCYFKDGTLGVPKETFDKVQVTILEGDWSNKISPDHFKGIESLGGNENNKIRLISCGKNINNSVLEIGEISSGGYLVNSDKIIRSKEFIRCSNRIYTGSLNNNDIFTFRNFKCYSQDKSFLGTASNGNELPNGTKFLKITIRKIDYSDITLNELENIKCQIEEGSKVTNYEEYRESTKEIILKDSLHKNNYLYEEEGKVNVYKNFENYKFTGEEPFEKYVSQSDGYLCLTLKQNDIKVNGEIYCNNFINQSIWSPGTLKEGIELNTTAGNKVIFIKIKSSKLTSNDIDGFKLWLKENPTAIVYELENPIIETLEDVVDLNIATFDKYTNVSFLNDVPGNLEFDTVNNLTTQTSNNGKNINTTMKELQNIKNEFIDKDLCSYEGNNLNYNSNKETYTCNTFIKGLSLKNNVLTPMLNKTYNANSTQIMDGYKVTRKKDTVYTLIAYVSQNSLNSNFSFISWGRVSDNGPIYIGPKVTGLIKKVFTTNSNIYEDYFFELWKENTSGSITIDYIMILEGDWSNKTAPLYFEGIKSFGEEENNQINLVSCNDNFAQSINKRITLSVGDKTDYYEIYHPPVGELYHGLLLNNQLVKASGVIVLFYDKDKKQIEWLTINDTPRFFNWNNIIEKAKYYKIHVANGESITFDNFYLSPKKDYIENSSYKKNTTLKQPLRGFNSIEDSLYDNSESQLSVCREIKEYVFTGNENFTVWNGASESSGCAYFNLDNTIDYCLTENNCLCSNLETLNSGSDSREGISLRTKGDFSRVYISIKKDKLESSTVEGLKKWLKNNRTVLLYQSYPYVENINSIDMNMKVFKGTNYININNNISNTVGFNIPISTTSTIENNSSNIDKISKVTTKSIKKLNDLENAQMTTALNVLELQKHTAMLDNGNINEYNDHSGTFIECNNTLDSRTENMIIKGNTLINLIPLIDENTKHKLSQAGQGLGIVKEIIKKGTYKWRRSSEGNGGYYPRIEIENNLKQGTTYTIQFCIETNIPNTNKGFNISYGDAYVGKIGNTTLINIGNPTEENLSYCKYTFTTYTTVTNKLNNILYLGFAPIGNDINGWIQISDIILLEGDWTNKEIPSYFEGLKSFGEAEQEGDKYKISILSRAKNLLDTNTNSENIEDGVFYDYKTGRKNTLEKAFTVNIPLKANTTFSMYGVNRNVSYWKNGIFKGSVSRDFADNSFTTQISPIYDCILKATVIKDSKDIAYLVLGDSELSPYEQYKQDKKDILLKKPLREWDTLYEDNGQVKVDRLSGQYTFTGNENFVKLNNDNNSLSVYVDMNTANLLLNGITVCNNFNYLAPNDLVSKYLDGISISGSIKNRFLFRISTSKLSTPDIDGFKAWLKANPTTVIYQLATPVTEIIDSIDINVDTYKDKTYITTDNEIQGELEFKTQNNFGAIMKNVNRCISKIFNSLNNILNIKGE